MAAIPESFSTQAFRAAFLLLALFVPFSIAGMNVALGLAALAWAAWVIARRGVRVRPDGLALAALALVVCALPSVLRSEDAARALRDWKSYWQLVIPFLVGAHVARVRAREPVFAVLAVSAAIACLVAFVQRAGGVHVGPLHIAAEHRVGGTLFTMTFAGILYQLVVMYSALATSARWARHRRWLVLVVVLASLALMLTMTRGAWIAVCVGMAVLCLLVRRRALLAAAAAGVAALVVFSFAFGRDQGRTISPAEFARADADRNVATRFVLWEISWEMFRENPVFGVGMGDYSIEANRRLEARKVKTTVDSHNVFLHILATRGLVGFVPFVVYFAVLLRSLAGILRRFDRRSVEWHYAAGAIAVTAAVLAGALTENNLDDSEVFITFMFLIGLARSALARETPVPVA